MKMHLICACLYSNDAKQIARALLILLPLSLSYFRFKLKLCCILGGAWGMLARQHIVIQLLL